LGSGSGSRSTSPPRWSRARGRRRELLRLRGDTTRGRTPQGWSWRGEPSCAAKPTLKTRSCPQACARPAWCTFPGSLRPTMLSAALPARPVRSRSMPVSMPMPCSMYTRSSVAQFPAAPGRTDIRRGRRRTRRNRGCRARARRTMFASAVPRCSCMLHRELWRGSIVSSAFWTMCAVCFGVPARSCRSRRSGSSPIERRRWAMATARSGSTSPS